MSDLERLELILRRIHARRGIANTNEGAHLNIDVQEFILELFEELKKANEK